MSEITEIPFKIKIALSVTILLWSSAYVGIRMGLESYSPGALALLRFLIASLVIFLIQVRIPKTQQMTLGDRFFLLLIGVVTIGGYHLALNTGELTVPSGLASFIICLMPVFTTIFSVLLFREKLNIVIIFGLLISLAGIGLMTLGASDHITWNIGVLFVLMAAMSGGIYSVLQKHFLKKYHALHVTAFTIWGGTLPLLFFMPQLSHEILTASWGATNAAIYLGIFPAAIAYAGWSYALSVMSASRAANFMYVTPLVATLLGWLFLGEVLPYLSLLGGLVALFGVWMVNYAHKNLLKISRLETA